jgi:DNA polymerase-1
MGRERTFLDVETSGLYGDLLFVGVFDGKSVRRYGSSFKVPKSFCGFNLKYDLKVMLSEKMIDFSYLREIEIEDLYVLSRLICPDLTDYSLQGVISLLYKEDIGSFENGLTRKQLEELNACQLRYMSKLYSDLYPEIERQGLEQVYRLENGLVPLIAEMEFLGILIDEKKKRKIEKVLLERRKQVISQLEKTFGNINLNSPKQLREVLYGKFKIKPIAYTPSGEPSTAHEVLEELALKYDFIKPLLEYRKIEKLLSTYLTDRMTGRVRASFNSLGTATGRFSSSNPNLQNIRVQNKRYVRC